MSLRHFWNFRDLTCRVPKYDSAPSRKYSRPLLDVFACGQVSLPRLRNAKKKNKIEIYFNIYWALLASQRMTRQTSFSRDVSISSLTNSKTRYESLFAHCYPSQNQKYKKTNTRKNRSFIQGLWGIYKKLDRYNTTHFKNLRSELTPIKPLGSKVAQNYKNL